MQITLITHSVVSIGPRILSSVLRRDGHRVRMVFLETDDFYGELYSDRVVEDVIELCRGSDLVGCSLMTNYHVRFADLTRRLKAVLDVPVVWGGIHPTVAPDECIAIADLICIGEAEEVLSEICARLADGRDLTGIAGTWSRDAAGIHQNELRPLETDLDSLPFQDIDPTHHYVHDEGRIVPLAGQMRDKLRSARETGDGLPEYALLTSRGCPHSCSFCCNNALRRLYGAHNYLRNRSPENAIAEAEHALAQMPFIAEFWLADDTFFARSADDIAHFCDLYKQRIARPLRCLASPATLREDKLAPLLDAGLVRLSLGVQAYDEGILRDIFNRPTSLAQIDRCLDMLRKVSPRLRMLTFHLIVDNPYETLEAKKQAVRLVTKLPKGSEVILHSLTPFPGTAIYERMMRDGLIHDPMRSIYLKYIASIRDIEHMDFLTYVLFHYSSRGGLKGAKGVQQHLTPLLLSDPVIKLLDHPPVLRFLERVRLSQAARRPLELLRRALRDRG